MELCLSNVGIKEICISFYINEDQQLINLPEYSFKNVEQTYYVIMNLQYVCLGEFNVFQSICLIFSTGFKKSSYSVL